MDEPEPDTDYITEEEKERRRYADFKLGKFFERAAGGYLDGRLDRLLPKETEEQKK